MGVWLRWFVTILLGLHLLWAVCLVGLRFINPITSSVQIQRRVESWLTRSSYRKQMQWTPLERISPHLQHAVIAAEDGHFYQHYGIDWGQVQAAVEESLEEGEVPRGASTITQQLVKNLFFTTHRNPIRKALEYTLAPMADVILGKRRVLELYLNIVEWGPGVWGAEAAAEYHYKTTAQKLTREQSSRLAACLPNPRRRRPAAMNRYSSIIEGRMTQLGW
jgi:monofunctional biosynthetic peptidoglycan transglycosylase